MVRDQLGARGHGVYLGMGHNGAWVQAPPQKAAMVLGPPRSGKTAGVVIPTVLSACGAVVSTSTKPDVMAATASARARVGRCLLFDPSGSVRPPPGVELLRWSPIPAARSWPAALAAGSAMVLASRPLGTATMLADGNHWTERAEALLAPLMHAAALEAEGARTLVRWVNRRECEPALAALARHGSDLAGDQLAGVLRSDSREMSGIWSTASGVLRAYRDDAALDGADGGSWEAAGFPKSSDTIYVCAAAHDQHRLAPLVVALIEEVRAATYSAAAGAVARGLVPEPPVLLALDEVANIAPLPGLPSLLAEGGGQGLVTLACFQDLSQARARWGQEADGFLSTFGTTLVLGGIGDVRTLETLSALAGDHDVEVRSTPGGVRGARARGRASRSARRQRRLPVDVIARGWPGYGLAFVGGEPSWVRLTPWYACDPWRLLA
ncbi:MAG: type IV secretory system conjugative DNA transfer family protein [Acidimicrobiales bacterium]